MATTNVQMNPYKIYFRPNFKNEVTRAENTTLLNNWSKQIFTLLDDYAKRFATISSDLHLSDLGRVASYTKLREEVGPQLEQFARGLGLRTADYFQMREKIFEVQPFKGTGNAAADEVRAAEIREHVRRLDGPAAIALYLSPLTSMEIVAAIENSPFPLLAADILARGKENQIERLNPIALEQLDDYRQVVEAIRLSIIAAYQYAEISLPEIPELLQELPETCCRE